jgi:hypothetical protein
MMTNLIKIKAIFGIIFLSLVVCSSYLKVGEGRAQVSFTYTAQIPQKTVEVSDTTIFFSTLTNIGSGSDTYDVDMVEKPPTPAVWWMRFCAGGVCGDSLVTHAHTTLGSGEYDNITLDILPRTLGTGKVTMRITSQTNPSVKDSITFTLYSVTKVPVFNRWGLVIFIILISSSGFYLMLRRLKLSKTN